MRDFDAMHHDGAMPQKLLTTEEVARRLGRDVATINRWVVDGKLEPAYQAPGVRGARLYEVTAVIKLIDLHGTKS